MSFALSCTLAHRLAAIGTVGAARVLPWEWCEEKRPLPVISFHGTGDTAVPYEGGSSWVGDVVFPDVDEWTAGWARRNRCEPDPVESLVADEVRRRSYRDCAQGSDVILYTILGGGHTWPGGAPLPEWFLGPTSQSVDATREMWDFFEQHPFVDRSGAAQDGTGAKTLPATP